MNKPKTRRSRKLVKDFVNALSEKLAASEIKYGYSEEWANPDWSQECRHEFFKHIEKGDAIDVAIYCAFLWYHKLRTSPLPIPAKAVEEMHEMNDRWNRLHDIIGTGPNDSWHNSPLTRVAEIIQERDDFRTARSHFRDESEGYKTLAANYAKELISIRSELGKSKAAQTAVLRLSIALQDAVRCFSIRETVVTPERLETWERTLEEFGRLDFPQGTSDRGTDE